MTSTCAHAHIYFHMHTGMRQHAHLPTWNTHMNMHSLLPYLLSVYSGCGVTAVRVIGTLPAFVEFIVLSDHKFKM